MFSLFYCLHTSSICILADLLVEYSNYSNKCYIQSEALISGEALTSGGRLPPSNKHLPSPLLPFQCGYPKKWCLFESGTYCLFVVQRLLEKIWYPFSDNICYHILSVSLV